MYIPLSAEQFPCCLCSFEHCWWWLSLELHSWKT